MGEPLWLSVARMLEGISEIPGAASNPVIVKWAKDIKAPAYDNDDVAWCAVFMNRLMQACQLPVAGSDYGLLRAMTFATWGEPLAMPSLGAVQVFLRPQGAHVHLYLGERADAYYGIGGNVSNSVSAAWLAKTRLVATRWPTGVPLPSSGIVQLADNGQAVSVNEA